MGLRFHAGNEQRYDNISIKEVKEIGANEWLNGERTGFFSQPDVNRQNE
jgi:hypothetical protein